MYVSGRNHIILHFSRGNISPDILSPKLTDRAMIAQSSFTRALFRPGFDIIVPPVLGPPGGDVWTECASQLPARRKYLMSFQGRQPTDKYDEDSQTFNSKFC